MATIIKFYGTFAHLSSIAKREYNRGNKVKCGAEPTGDKRFIAVVEYSSTNPIKLSGEKYEVINEWPSYIGEPKAA